MLALKSIYFSYFFFYTASLNLIKRLNDRRINSKFNDTVIKILIFSKIVQKCHLQFILSIQILFLLFAKHLSSLFYN